MRAICRSFLLLTLLTLASNFLAQQSSTTVPNLIRYGGVLKDARGAAIASRIVGLTFLIYGQQDGGAPVWLETQNVATDAAGQFNVLLGSSTATGLPGDLFAQQEQRWLAVKAEGQPEQPRVLLVSVPYAMKAAVADTLAGHSASEFVTTDNLQTAVQQQLQGQGATVPAGVPNIASGTSSTAGSAPVPTNPATNFVDNTTNQVVQVTQNGTGFGLNASASTPTGVGVLGTVSSSPKAGISAGVEGTSSINNGFGVFGYSTATSLGIGVQGRSDSSNGIGLRGFTIGTSGIAVNALSNATSGNPVGLYASVSAPGGTGALITNIATGTITGPLINAVTNNVTQFAVGATGNVFATGWLSGKQLISTVPTGTAPLQVASTTQVPNLNASLLGGNAATAFAPARGSINYIWNGTLPQPSANFNISGNGTANSFNSATSYQIGGSNVLGIALYPQSTYVGVSAGGNDSGGYNTFMGYGSGYNNTNGSENAFYGDEAGYFNTTGNGNSFFGSLAGEFNTGSNNAFFGSAAGIYNSGGGGNTFLGNSAGFSNSGGGNTFSGYRSGLLNTTGYENAFFGDVAGSNNTTGYFNMFIGSSAGGANITGAFNTFVGASAGGSNPNGSFNSYYGFGAGFNNNGGSSNVYLASYGPASTGSESNILRLGWPYSSLQSSCPDQPAPCGQNAAFIAGVYGSSVGGSGIAVYIDNNGQLGTTVSSRRFKEQIHDMGDSTSALMKLRPVTFLYKPEYDKGPRMLQYGLIAEEVAEVYPDLVAYEPDGKPYTVKYQYLTTMLLNEVQKQYHRAETQEQNMKAQSEVIQTQQQNIQTQAEVMKAQQQEIDSLKAQLRLQNTVFQERLSRLESMVGTQTQIAADLPPR